MKRLIKFYTHHTSHNDKPDFSNCSSRFEVLPYLVDDKAGPTVLARLAKELGLKTAGPAAKVKRTGYARYQSITHAMPLKTFASGSGMYAKEKYREWLAFIPMPKTDRAGISLKPSLKPGKKMTKVQANEIVNMQAFGVSDVGEHVNGETILVKEGWDFYTDMRILGYDHTQFLKILKCEDYGFSDDTSRCSDCGKFASNESGYTSNFRYLDAIGELGIECGCYDEHASSADGLDQYAGKDSEAMELDAAKVHAEAGRIKFIERFIGGMTDRGRGGYWGGDATSDADYAAEGSVRNGNPKAVLKALKAANPKGVYMFSHDDSGQFQTYFSVWEIVKGPVSQAKFLKAKQALFDTNLEAAAS